ncbi:SDR family oxidoreductase [Thalassiella azotivora]
MVVTGGGSGIGAELARACAAAGAHVVVNDVDPGSARAVADEVGGTAAPGDVTDPQLVTRLVDGTWAGHGRLDVFFANAGVAPPGSVDAPAEVWRTAWDVNVMSHVVAAQALLPRWLEAGRGHLVTTVSAAGLLTLLGKAAYAVTKHAALAFSEWLRATYAHRGVVVQAVCPQGVLTPMLASADGTSSALLTTGALSPQEVARATLDALPSGRFLVLPHPEVSRWYATRAADPDRWLAGMNRLQQEVEGRRAGSRFADGPNADGSDADGQAGPGDVVAPAPAG